MHANRDIRASALADLCSVESFRITLAGTRRRNVPHRYLASFQSQDCREQQCPRLSGLCNSSASHIAVEDPQPHAKAGQRSLQLIGNPRQPGGSMPCTGRVTGATRTDMQTHACRCCGLPCAVSEAACLRPTLSAALTVCLLTAAGTARLPPPPGRRHPPRRLRAA